MICDLFSLPLPENTALRPACGLSPDAHHSQPICLAYIPCPALPCPRPARSLNHPLDTLSASFPYSLPLATPLAGAKLLLQPHLSYIPRHHSRSPSSHHRVSTPAPIANKSAPVPNFMWSDELRLSPPFLGNASSRHQRLTLAPSKQGVLEAFLSACVGHCVVEDVSVFRPVPARSVGEDRRGCLHTFDAVTHRASKRHPSGKPISS